HFIGTDYGIPLAQNYAVFGAIAGSFLGFIGLMYLVSKGKAHAGLPLLNGGTIAGFFAGVFALDIPVQQIVGL
ncbi:MAG: presenilin family intramembrane aspartyl protease, partial [Halobacteria archaeon]|nr:presenilin family intramembrane aspartyl protease [Halobacteria archaeon]